MRVSRSNPILQRMPWPEDVTMGAFTELKDQLSVLPTADLKTLTQGGSYRMSDWVGKVV